MAQYKVMSSMLADLTEGSIISDVDLEGLNVQALIEGGHIDSVAMPKQAKTQDKDA
jgi:hypothetical protein